MSRHAFTVEEANALLPHVRATLRRIRFGRQAAGRRLDKLGVLELLWGKAVHEPEHVDHDEYLAHRRSLGRIQRAIERLARERLTERGIRFPTGGIERGLVDFPTTLDGRWVYLCWQLEEPEVTWWHEVDGGFTGRRPITPDQAERMGRADDPARRDDSALDF